jgi:hypothetical protein
VITAACKRTAGHTTNGGCCHSIKMKFLAGALLLLLLLLMLLLLLLLLAGMAQSV